MEWDLNDLYSSFDSKEYKEDKNKLNSLIIEINNWSEENLSSLNNTKEKIETFLNYKIQIQNITTKLITFSNLTSSTNATDEIALQEFESLIMKNAEITGANVKFKLFLSKLDNLSEIINTSNLLKEHEFYLNELKEQTKYMLEEREEIIISKMKNTGSDAWSNLQEQISATLLVDIILDGKEKKLPLSSIRNLANSPDPQIRKTAYLSELEAYKQIEKSSAAALNGIKGEVITTSKLRGYNSPLEMTLNDSRLKKETLNSMFLAMEKSFPDFERYFKAKSKYLGHKKGLPFYDLFAPVGKSNIEFSYEEASNYIINNFKSFSEKLSDFASKAIQNSWIDVKPKEGKRGGAFCSNIHPIKQSRFLLNFDGSFSDVLTMAHELGHGYHGEQLINESILNSNYPMPLAETASIFCETIVLNSALSHANKDEELAILEASLQGSSQVIVDIYCRYLFETELFKRREKASLSVEEMKDIMIQSQIKTYGQGLDKNYLHPYMWICKTHYYSANRNFYNFPYAFGLLFAKGLYAIYLEDKNKFLKDYDDLLKSTGKKTIEDVALMMNIDIQNPKFFENALNLIIKDIDRYIELIK